MGKEDVMSLEYIVDGILIEQSLSDNTAKKRLMAARFKFVREQSGMNRKEFAEWLAIPYRTMQDWELGTAQVPEYLLRLIAYKVQIEKERGNI